MPIGFENILSRPPVLFIDPITEKAYAAPALEQTVLYGGLNCRQNRVK
jgi:hypothetical protein